MDKSKKLYRKEEGKMLLEQLNLNENVRPEELTLEQFAKISDLIKK